MNIANQEPFIKATRELLGEHSCYPLVAIEKLKKKAAWQLYAGANDVSPEDANEISKFITKYDEKMKYADEIDKEFILVEDFIPEEYMSLYMKSLEYQGITINAKAHPCGYLILSGDIRRKIGLIRTTSETTGKFVLCANMEGAYLDEFGYVKNDYLIVDSVHLVYELFKSIGREVPSFDELREMIKGDKPTWDIYANGITCCVNQVEKESTTKKAKNYKPTNLAELSAFIAGIRPGFRSLINDFIKRVPYSNGVPQLDELLADSYGYLLYQESIMRLLAYLGLPMTKCYETIKKISKKKFKQKQLEELKSKLKKGWEIKIGDLSKFEDIWETVENFAKYGFNAPHALSMGGDSVYEAWFKAHHTAKFYEVAINHYQAKNKKDKIDALVKEAMEFFGYRLGDYEFGKDNRKVNVDEENKIIYPNLSSIKGFGEGVATTLYDMGLVTYTDFTLFLDALKGGKINRTVVSKLIKLNYFKQFGGINYLLKVVEWYDIFRDSKEIGKEKAIGLGLSLEFMLIYGNETAKKITKLRAEDLLRDIIKGIEDTPLTVCETIKNQKEILGIITLIDPSYSSKVFYVSELEVLKSIVHMTLYRIKDGKNTELKMWTSGFNKNDFELGDFLYLEKVDKKPQQTPTGEINLETGKKIYMDVEGTNEFWLKKYKVVTYEFTDCD